ncbi:MAG: vWA domain-containing protein [Coriobacteriia bacterium]|nr:vWA domain-containing protein [Coriobacteriia bacterium]
MMKFFGKQAKQGKGATWGKDAAGRDPWAACPAASPSPAQDYTELVLIVDKSGSMAGMESDTIGGINALLHKHRKGGVPTLVTVVLFDHEAQVLVNRQDIAQAADLTEDDYQPGGCTALLDAVGGAISHVRQVQGYQPAGFQAANLIFVITTDGYENASRTYDYDQVKRLISATEEEGWSYLFLGANIDAAEEAGKIGIGAEYAANYVPDAAGSAVMYEAVCAATADMSAAPRRAARMALAGSSWRDSVDRDHAARG